jgi:hypothetical protein
MIYDEPRIPPLIDDATTRGRKNGVVCVDLTPDHATVSVGDDVHGVQGRVRNLSRGSRHWQSRAAFQARMNTPSPAASCQLLALFSERRHGIIGWNLESPARLWGRVADIARHARHQTIPIVTS